MMNDSSTIQGVVFGQNERVEQLNDRISFRNMPDMPLEPNFDPRPVSTKYALFPIIDRRTPTNTMIMPFPNYILQHNFNPGDSKGPVSGFLGKVGLESELRNQNFALQRGAGQNVFVPSSNSDLYHVTVPKRSSQTFDEATHPFLFTTFDKRAFANNSFTEQPIGKDVFYNHTRTQLRGL